MSNIYDELFGELQSSVGKEGEEELEENNKFLHKILDEAAEMVALLYAIGRIGGENEVDLMLTTFFTGAAAYREWLITQGVDVLKLEGRI